MRIKRGNVLRKRHKKILKLAKGFKGARSRIFKVANTAVMKKLKYQYRDRRVLKRNMRALWIVRINAACRLNDISYSKFVGGLNKAGVLVNRKMLSEIAINDPKAFSELVKVAKDGKAGKVKPATEVTGNEVTIGAAKKETKSKKNGVIRGHKTESPSPFPVKGSRCGWAATYFPTLSRSIIGAAGLNFSVRDGKRCAPALVPPLVCLAACPRVLGLPRGCGDGCGKKGGAFPDGRGRAPRGRECSGH